MTSLTKLSRGALLAAGVLALGACDILDVENPNNMVEDDIHEPTAASSVVSGALAVVTRAIGGVLQPYSVVGDEVYWIGSRDAWLSLDQGLISDPNNEFTNGVFPWLGEARWMADEAVAILEEHRELGNEYDEIDRGRAYFIAGLMYTFLGEVQDDFAFSHKKEASPPVGQAGMIGVFDQAITYLGEALTIARAEGAKDLELRTLALRARAKHSKAVRQKIQPSIASSPWVDAGTDDAAAFVGEMGLEDWKWQLEYDAATIGNDMAGWINSRAENQFGPAYVTVDPASIKTITGYVLEDPSTGAVDPRIEQTIKAFIAGGSYSELTWLSNREMHLILAESELAKGNAAGATTHINHVRTMSGMAAYDGASPAVADMLKHERRVNLFIQARRLSDMYRFGEQDPKWLPGSQCVTAPGTLLPITIIEILANPHISG